MSKYVRCPNCGNEEENTRVYRCKECRTIYCGRCKDGDRCPICDAYYEYEWVAEIG